MWSALSLECVLHKPEQSSKISMRLQSVAGGAVTILAVTPGGLAASAGLLAGDELRKVNGNAVLSGDDVTSLLSQAVGPVSVRVMRGNLPPAAAAAPATTAPAATAAPTAAASDGAGAALPSPPLPAEFTLAPVEVHEFIYHEKQVSALCGVHALNNLLQGSFGAWNGIAQSCGSGARALAPTIFGSAFAAAYAADLPEHLPFLVLCATCAIACVCVMRSGADGGTCCARRRPATSTQCT